MLMLTYEESVMIIDEMVNRFLVWKLPAGFSPDAGVSFTPLKNGGWPTGTNLFTAEQATAMIEHITGGHLTAAIDMIVEYGGIDGAHHKAWVLDQVLRILTGKGYDELIKSVKDGEDGPDTYDWDEGIAP
jgi:hypothetical protein